jgi:hypothetical protein
MLHELKLQTDYFQRKRLGFKPWEIRDAQDRDFQPGDTVKFFEHHRDGTTSTASLGPYTITYVIGNSPGLAPGYVIFTHT